MSKSKYSKEYKQRQRKKMIAKVGLFLILIAVLAGVIFYGLFYADRFDIREVKIDGARNIDKEYAILLINQWLDKKDWGIVHRNNTYVFSPSAVKDLLIETFPRIERVNVIRTDAHTLIVDVQEREPVGIWCVTREEKCYYFDAHGIAFSEVERSLGYIYSNVSDHRDTVVKLGKKVEDHVWIDNMLLTQRTLQFGNIGIDGFHIASSSVDVFAVDTTQGWEIRLSNQTNIARQLESLFGFMREKITTQELEELEYVDLTIKDRIYYK